MPGSSALTTYSFSRSTKSMAGNDGRKLSSKALNGSSSNARRPKGYAAKRKNSPNTRSISRRRLNNGCHASSKADGTFSAPVFTATLPASASVFSVSFFDITLLLTSGTHSSNCGLYGFAQRPAVGGSHQLANVRAADLDERLVIATLEV